MLTSTCRQDIEQQLGSLILATDISRQNEFLSTFREHLDKQDLDLQLPSHRHFILQVAGIHPIYSHCQIRDLKVIVRVASVSVASQYVCVVVVVVFRLLSSVQTSVTHVGFGS